MTHPAAVTLGPIPEVGSFQRRRVRLTAVAIVAMSTVSAALVVWSAVTHGVAVTFGGNTPVRLPIGALAAAVILSPIVWSATFRSSRFGATLTKDALIVESWWRRLTFDRSAISAAEPLPGVMRLRDGYFSGRGSNDQAFVVWLWPKNPEQTEIPLGVTTGSWRATSIAAHRINTWLGVEIDFDQARADSLLDEE